MAAWEEQIGDTLTIYAGYYDECGIQYLDSIKVVIDNEQNESSEIKMNPYDNLPLHRKLIDKKNNKVGIFDLGNHILIIGFILIVVFVALNVG